MQALITNLKGLPLTYNRDLQEDKVYLFDSIRQARQGLLGLTEIINHIRFNEERVIENLSRGFSLATDIADYLVREKGIAFRDAHGIAGNSVAYAEKNGKRLEELASADWQLIAGYDPKFPADFFTPQASVKRRQGYGSTNPEAVAQQLTEAQDFLNKAR